jgi:saccharopine dehydrogenase-like NADP-dependent oxidoreductase
VSLRVLVAGGTGLFGQTIVQELLNSTLAIEVAIAARHLPRGLLPSVANGKPVEFITLNLHDLASLQHVLIGRDVLVLAAGPFQNLSPEIARVAAESGVHYIDLCDDPVYFSAVTALSAVWQGTARVCLTGLSSLPGISLPLATLLQEKFDRIDDIDIGLFIGNANRKGRGAVFSSLKALGQLVPVWREGTLTSRPGGTEAVDFPYPDPIGKVKSTLIASPDASAFVRFGPIKNLSARVGFEWALARAAFSFFRILAMAGAPALVRWLVNLMFPFFSLMHSFGTQRGSVTVLMRGEKNGQPCTWRASLVGESHGQKMASLPAVIACEALAKSEIVGEGVRPLNEWLPPREFLSRLEKHGFTLSLEKL